MMVVVAEDHDHGYADVVQLCRQNTSFLGLPAPRQVAGDQEHVGAVGQASQVRPKRPGRIRPEMDIPDGSDPDQIGSTSVGSEIGVTIVSLCTS